MNSTRQSQKQEKSTSLGLFQTYHSKTTVIKSLQNSYCDNLKTEENKSQILMYEPESQTNNKPTKLLSDEANTLNKPLQFNTDARTETEDDCLVSKRNNRKFVLDLERNLPSMTRTHCSNSYRHTGSNFAERMPYYKASESSDRKSTLHDLKRKSTDLVQRSIKALGDIKSEKKLDFNDYQYLSLDSVKSSLYHKKALKYEYNQDLKLSSQLTDLKTTQLLRKLKNNDLNFEKWSQMQNDLVIETSEYDNAPYSSRYKFDNQMAISQDISNFYNRCVKKQKSDHKTNDNLFASLIVNGSFGKSMMSSCGIRLSLSKNYQFICSKSKFSKKMSYEPLIPVLVKKIEFLFKSQVLSELKSIIANPVETSDSNHIKINTSNNTDILTYTRKNSAPCNGLEKNSKKNQIELFRPEKNLNTNTNFRDSLKTIKKNTITQKSSGTIKYGFNNFVFRRKGQTEVKRSVFQEIRNFGDK